ncbi:MAG: DUF5916 domain-containing protein [Ignavibacteriales bacterium]|nr:DUF5916 domain-containing protein [Ignavibacteriales bacterium]
MATYPMSRSIILLVMMWAFCFFPLTASGGGNLKKAFAVRTSVAPRLDGIMNEPEWKLAVPASGFLQQDPVEGAPATMPTEIYVLYDDEALYFGCRMHDNDPSKIIARLARRDDEVFADVISLRLDTYHDHQTAFVFTINAAGSKTDVIQFNDGVDEDKSWDVVWDVETRIDGEGWVAEVKIPFKVLRFTPAESLDWGFQVIRQIARNNELQMWALIRKSESGFVSRFGHLVGIQNIPAPANLEVIPYVVGASRFVPKSLSYPDGREFTKNAGFDLKYRPGSGLTIDATVNPDFGQVEADPAVLNLSTYETRYPEKRPFFIEGSQIFLFSTYGGEGLFYSRRIGRALDIKAPPGGYVLDQPRFATILGAVKISGKTEGGLSVGVLEAITSKETATMVHADGHRTEETVEPLTNYGLIRLRQDVLANSNVGMIVTSVSRDQRLPAMTAGIDWDLNFLENVYKIDGFFCGSRTTDASGHRMDGTGANFTFSKVGGPHWRGLVSYDWQGDTYSTNDIGFIRRPNEYNWVGQIGYRDDVVRTMERFWSIGAKYRIRRNFDDADLNNVITLDGDITFSNYWTLGVGGEVDRGRYDDRETRGNGLYRRPGTQTGSISIKSDQRALVVAGLDLNLGSDEQSGRDFGIGVDLAVKAASNINLTFALERSVSHNKFAWAATILEPPADSLQSPRTVAVFADRSSKEWSLTGRGSYVFTPELSIEAYFQIFFAQGKYEKFHRLLASDRFEALEGFTRPDFNDLSFNSSFVLRWEYLPGSTLFLVWSQARKGEYGTYRTPFSDNFSNTFELPADNVLLLKISYWLSR